VREQFDAWNRRNTAQLVQEVRDVVDAIDHFAARFK